ncbi:MAG: carbon monoxide dehydrogenase subunit G [Pseudomonadota bacterium]
MDMTGEHRIAAPRDVVWRALNDEAVLRECIPGCQELAKQSDTEFSATIVQKIGPVKAKFTGNVELTNMSAPDSYTIRGEGSGGVAGFAKGGADVALIEDGGETILTYTVHATIGGKLARLGSRLIDSTARKLAGQFFESFEAYLNPAALNETDSDAA